MSALLAGIAEQENDRRSPHPRQEEIFVSKRGHDISLRLLKALNVALMVACFAVVWYVYYADTIVSPYGGKGNWAVILIFAVQYIALGRTYDGFLISYNRISQIIYSQCLAVAISDGFMFVIIWLLAKSFPWIVPGILTLLAQVFIITLWAIFSHHWYYKKFEPQKTIVVYDVREGLERLIDEYGFNRKFEVTATMPVEECLEHLDSLKGLGTVFLSGIHSHERNIILKYCIANGIRVMVIPRVGDVIMSSAKKLHLFYLPMLMVERCTLTPEYELIKRVGDILVSGAALIILSPVIGITAAAIKLTDKGPVFYKQTRLTKDGKEFRILKFRSMRVDAEKDGVARLSTGADDDRITPIGRVIRAVRLDELPQLINVLKGDMSIVGPRPERPEIAAQYEQEMPEFRLRLQMKAGITGYAQVYGKYNTTPYDKLQMDLMYIARPNIVEDLAIMFATVKILFLPESTEGVAVGQTTAMDHENTADSTDNSAETVGK